MLRLFLALMPTAAAALTVASITPDPAPIGAVEQLTIHMEGVTEEDLFGRRNSLRLTWPTSERGGQNHVLEGWPPAGSAPADGKVDCTLTRSTASRWPETGAIVVRVRAAYEISSELGWITIRDAGCGGADACSIEFDTTSPNGAEEWQFSREDPSTTYNFMAIGDWGDDNADGGQYLVAAGMGAVAEEIKANQVIALGDNFYHTSQSHCKNSGICPNNADGIDGALRFKSTFENVYSAESLERIPWYAIAGNHDHGGKQG